jgi:hypothetical protein
MALRFCSRIDRRQAILGLLAAGGAAALSAKAPAVPAPETGKAYAAFFLGQGGYVFSWGIPLLEWEARKLGLATDVFSYTDLNAAWANIVLRRKDGYKIALIGYSLGNTTATFLQRHLAVDLLLAISESSLGQNHPIEKKNTRRAVLWYGPDMLSSAGVHDGFDETNYIENTHLLMDVDPRVIRGVLDELKRLVAPEHHDEQIVAANRPAPEPIVSRLESKIATAPAPPIKDKVITAPAQPVSAARLPPANSVTPDVTCKSCWGFAPSLSAPWSDPWMP